jgi:26S proteasome regulatory subunit N1
MLVERLKEDNTELYKESLNTLRSIIKTSTTSMTSVPKPLKFLSKHFDTLKEVYEKLPEGPVKKNCSDVVSIIAMTVSETRECLKFKLLGERGDIGEWGHEYIRHLAGEISQEW